MRTFTFCSALCLLPLAAARPQPYNTDDHGAVASEVDLCSHVGVDLMQSGGNAADAVSSARRYTPHPANDV